MLGAILIICLLPSTLLLSAALFFLRYCTSLTLPEFVHAGLAAITSLCS
jgi:hypothetical protein